jgi:hypothetical protein
MIEISSEEIHRSQYTQHNYKSSYQGGCYTYDWHIDGAKTDKTNNMEIIELSFESVDEIADNSPYSDKDVKKHVMIKKPILIAKDGQQRPFKRVVNEPHRVVYRGKLSLEERENSRVRYWRPESASNMMAERIKVAETWYQSVAYP